MPFSLHGMLLQVASAPPTVPDPEKPLHQTLVAIAAVVVFASIAAAAEKLTHLIEFWTEGGMRLPFWPTFIVLCGFAIVLAWPEIHDYAEVGHYASVDARVETLQGEALMELMRSPANMCTADAAQRELDEAQAEALDALDEHAHAEAVRGSSPTPNPTCPTPVPMGG